MLVVTTFEHDEYVYDALRAGASGFVLKRVQPEELAQAVRIVASGESLLFPALTRGSSSGTPPRRAERPPRLLLAQLTDREAETLRLVARGRSNQEIADEFVVAVHTVKTHVARVLAKLEAPRPHPGRRARLRDGFVQPGE